MLVVVNWGASLEGFGIVVSKNTELSMSNQNPEY